MRQAMGENLVAAVLGLAKQMVGGGQHELLASKAVFFDVLGYFMVRSKFHGCNRHAVCDALGRRSAC